MPRIETASQAHDKDIEKKLEQIESRVKHSNRHIFSCFNCLIYFLILLLVGGFFLGRAVAKSGYIHVPYFSSSFFSAPKPDHVVMPAQNPSQSTLYDQIKTQIATAELSNGKTASIPVIFTESQMSAALLSYLNRNSQVYDQAQVAVVGQSLEIFLHAKNSTRYITASIVPAFDENGLKIQVQSLKVGLLSIPTVFLNWGVKVIFADSLSRVNDWLKNYTHVQSLTWKPGAIEVDLQILNNGTLFNGL